MKLRLPWLALATSVALLLLALPLVAQDTTALTTSAAPAATALQNEQPPTLTALPNEQPSTLSYDLDWKSKGDASARRIARERDVEMWSLALLGPAAMLLIVVALGITVTVRSLREDFRRQRSLNGYWRRGTMSRASHANRD